MEHINQGQNGPSHNGQRQHDRHGAPTGFEGMNFEEQRGSYKNSDGAGVSYSREESLRERKGRSGPEE
ncbi:hypothetical protein [Flaviaesturariibacter aridisoli]|uniref:Uncharacterized protein n=1 Tax=Flaviaesturariibacter aridisoli TaxID=2545761 RepID=A0A4R4E9B8_9BACT|nr:hypothetical protein [Flaviaesturariibacter aridisoli]TCZ74428.1 hypothetical protein E0486_02035 [Flaviaesturariibacter aridisoli]